MKDPTSDLDLLPHEVRRCMAFILLKRYCFIGKFEPVRRHLPLPAVGDYKLLNKCSRLLDPQHIVHIVHTAMNSKLFRRDEVTFLLVAYLMGGAERTHKTKVRLEFVNLVKTDADLFLFCKYAAVVHKDLEKPIFCKTIKKAITAWYGSKSSKELAEMFRTGRGRNGFTHGALLKICHIGDHTLGTKYIYDSYNKTCTTIVAQRANRLPPTPAYKMVKRRLLIGRATTTAGILPSATAATTNITRDNVISTQAYFIPPKQCNPEEIRADILAISKLRTGIGSREAIEIIGKFNLGFEHLPYEFLKNPSVLKKVIPSMSCEQLLKCFHAKNTRKHFTKSEVIAVCRSKFLKKNALKNEDVDPIMCLINLDNLNVKEPTQPTNNKNSNRGRIVQFSKILFRDSFNHTKPMNLSIHITINMQEFYMKKILKNTNCTGYKYAALALAFTFFKAEDNCNVFRWCELEDQLLPVEFQKDFHIKQAFQEIDKVENLKNKQHLWLPIVDAQKRNKKYDLFICIVPSATRGNKKHCSENLAQYLAKYRRACLNRAKLVIVDLCRYRQSMKYATNSCENILEICGLDIHTVGVIRNFALGIFD